jgi:hypothetical protein
MSEGCFVKLGYKTKCGKTPHLQNSSRQEAVRGHGELRRETLSIRRAKIAKKRQIWLRELEYFGEIHG